MKKAHYDVQTGTLSFELEGKLNKDIFEGVAAIQEVFGDKACGVCGSDHIHYRVRERDGNKFYEGFCEDCFAKLEFGSYKESNDLFPKRSREVDGQKVWDTRGWYRWVNGAEVYTAPASNKSNAPPASDNPPYRAKGK